jgi:hypothetical protein
MMLLWDGLQVQLPHTMEPATLDLGYIRLFGPELPTIDLRFGPEKKRFDPHKDGRRILRAAGLSHVTLEPCIESWSQHLPGTLYQGSRLYVLPFGESRGVVAALFSTPTQPAMVQRLITSLAWTPPEAWRRWCCYDITFETPPGYVLTKAAFRPGRFRLMFANRYSVLTFDRLAPANTLLGNTPLLEWCRQYACREFGVGVKVIPCGSSEADLIQKPSLLYRPLAWLPGLRLPLKGKIRFVSEENKILALTEQGPHIADAISHRLHTSYATTTSLQK